MSSLNIYRTATSKNTSGWIFLISIFSLFLKDFYWFIRVVMYWNSSIFFLLSQHWIHWLSNGLFHSSKIGRLAIIRMGEVGGRMSEIFFKNQSSTTTRPTPKIKKEGRRVHVLSLSNLFGTSTVRFFFQYLGTPLLLQFQHRYFFQITFFVNYQNHYAMQCLFGDLTGMDSLMAYIPTLPTWVGDSWFQSATPALPPILKISRFWKI